MYAKVILQCANSKICRNLFGCKENILYSVQCAHCAVGWVLAGKTDITQNELLSPHAYPFATNNFDEIKNTNLSSPQCYVHYDNTINRNYTVFNLENSDMNSEITECSMLWWLISLSPPSQYAGNDRLAL